jgi:mono/diheme cytochrome c family protein
MSNGSRETFDPIAPRLGSLALLAAVLSVAACHAESPTQPLPSASSPGPATASAVVTVTPPPSASSAPPVASVAPPPARDTARGGQLFDKWKLPGFKADDAKTKGKADGTGGPKNDGTLLASDGKPLLNTGHDYRLKNLFGWDLRGKSGIYGPDLMKKDFVLGVNLLEGKQTEAELVTLLSGGSAEIPAFAAVLDPAQLADVAAFIIGVRDRTLVHPADVFELAKSSPGNYKLRAGGDGERGKALFTARCAGCHGDDGTTLLFDDAEFSLGTHARQKAYEDWLKILNGQPGTAMGRQLQGDNAQMTRELLDLFAALCDRKAFPKGKAKGKDVPDADPRCGAYLK